MNGLAALITELYHRDREGFIHDFWVAVFLVAVLGVGSAVCLVLADWVVNG